MPKQANQLWVVKAQIHAGGRGKGKIEGTEQRGVAVGKSADDIKNIATNLLGGKLVTIQTGAAGKIVNKIFTSWNRTRGDLNFSEKTFNQLWKEKHKK